MTLPAINIPYTIISDAMRDACLLQLGDEPTPEQLAENMRRLRDIINLWQTQGLKLWMQRDITVPLVLNQSLYSFSPGGDVNMTKPLRVTRAYYLYNYGAVRAVYPISREEYVRLDRASSGSIINYFVDKQATEMLVTLWQMPNATEVANGTVHLIIQAQVTNPSSLLETMEFPEEWRMALRWGLADDIATGQPQAIMERCSMRAEAYRRSLEDWDVEDASVYFSPDRRYMTWSSFR